MDIVDGVTDRRPTMTEEELKRVIAQAQAEYDRIIAEAKANRNRADDRAKAEYNRVTARARAEYDDVIMIIGAVAANGWYTPFDRNRDIQDRHDWD